MSAFTVHCSYLKKSVSRAFPKLSSTPAIIRIKVTLFFVCILQTYIVAIIILNTKDNSRFYVTICNTS